MPPKTNTILGFYTADGLETDDDNEYFDYAQIELLGNHARDAAANGDCDHIMLISRSDLNLVMNFQWYLNASGYPATYGSIDSGGVRCSAPYPMHQFLHPECPEGYVVDHINRNRLDNRRENLRIITAKQNSYNRKKPKNSKSRYKGVRQQTKTPGNIKYKASISKDGKTYEIKDCATEKEAALAYDAMAEELFGIYAGKNFADS